MTAPVRPPILPPAPPASGAHRPDAARLAAQRAFFDLALGKASAPAAAAAPPPAPPTAPRAAMQSRSADPENPPQKILRPGSLIDIRV